MSYTTIHQALDGINKPLSSLTVQYEGEWKKFNNLLKYLDSGTASKGIKRDIAKAQRDYLGAMKRSLISGLQSGGTSIGTTFPLRSYPYKGSVVPGVRKSHYLNALRTAEITSKNYEVRLKMSKTAVSYRPRKGGATVGQYATFYELGTKKQPARPLWHQTFAYLGGKTRVLNNIYSAVGSRLSSMGIKIAHTGYTYLK